MFLQPDLFDAREESRPSAPESLDLPDLIERIADVSPRPRYAFMVLNLIAKVANSNSGSAGPYVMDRDRRVPLRDWLCDSLVPMAKRDARRLAIVEEVRASLNRAKMLPSDTDAADRLVEEEVQARVRRSGRCNVSRAVADLVRAGLVRRGYQGFPDRGSAHAGLD